jgi:hypothetical protein
LATISNTPRPGYVWDSADNVWYPIGVGAHQHTNAADTPAVIPNALVDAKGDLLTATADNTPARLAVGANGDTLVADSSTATGLRYTAGTVQANPFINSAMQVWQRGTSFVPSTASVYTADRWQGYRGVAGSTVSRQATGDTTNLPNIQYCARIQRDSGNTSTATIYFGQSFESVNSIPFAGKTVTLSFYARKGANYSTTASDLSFLLQGGALTDANVITAGGWSTITTLTATLTTTWQRFSITATVPSSYTQLGTYGVFNPTGTAGAADYCEVTGFQLDIGSVALPFRTNGGSIEAELALCQRYYVRLGGAHLYESMGGGAFESSTVGVLLFPCPVTLRIAATSVEFSSIYAWDYGAARTITNVAINNSGKNVVNLLLTLTGGTQYRPLRVETNNSLNGYIAVSAEL